MDKLGIEPTLLGAQVINFLVILFVLNKLLYKPVLDMIEKRKKEIAEGLNLTEKMKEEEIKFEERQEKALGKARDQAVGILDEAKKQAKEVEKELVADAHRQAAAIIDRAKDEAREVEKASQKRLQEEAVKLALVMSQRVLSSVMTAKEQHAFIASQMKELSRWAEKQGKEYVQK